MRLQAELALPAQLFAIAGQPGPVLEFEAGEVIALRSRPAVGLGIGQKVERAGVWSVM